MKVQRKILHSHLTPDAKHRKKKNGALSGRTVTAPEYPNPNWTKSPWTKVAVAVGAVAILAATVQFWLSTGTSAKLAELEESIQNQFVLKDKANIDRFNLSPTHKAIFLNQEDLIETLHQYGADIDQKDIHGFTPLQHAAMKGNTVAVDKLLSLGANPEHRNNLGGTYADYLRFTEPYRTETDYPLDPTHFSAHRNDKIEVDPLCMPAGVTFVEENVLSRERLYRMWLKHNPNEKVDDPSLEIEEQTAKYENFKKSPPKIAVKRITKNDAGENLKLGPLFCGVVANQAIKKNDPIVEYTGEMYIENVIKYGDDIDAEYLWDEWPAVDGQFFRSAGALINHAFPNAHMKAHFAANEPGLDGLPYRKILVAAADIAEGEEITIDYGDRYVWKVKPSELKIDALKAFAKKHSWKNLLENFQSIVNDEGLLTQYVYVLKSTDSLVALAKAKLLNYNDLKHIETLIQILPENFRPDLSKVRKAI